MTYIYCMETITSHVINVTPELNSIIKKSFDFKISRTGNDQYWIYSQWIFVFPMAEQQNPININNLCAKKPYHFLYRKWFKVCFFYKGYFSETNNRATQHLFTKCPDVKEICDWKLVLNLITWFCRFFKNKPVE